MLEKSLADFCEIYRGFTVWAVEKELQALPQNLENENPAEDSSSFECGYYFSGKVDCILASPNERDFTIIDFKTTILPGNLFEKEKENGKPEPVIDFQMPMYVYLLENSLEESERLNIERAMFYSIKTGEKKFFLGSAPDAQKPEKNSTPENAKLAENSFLTFAKRFYDEVSDEKFAVDALNQSRIVCTKKGKYDNCIDYQAICRRYFSVSGEKI